MRQALQEHAANNKSTADGGAGRHDKRVRGREGNHLARKAGDGGSGGDKTAEERGGKAADAAADAASKDRGGKVGAGGDGCGEIEGLGSFVDSIIDDRRAYEDGCCTGCERR